MTPAPEGPGAPDAPGSPHRPLTGLDIAMQWAELPAEHLQIALAALEPQLKREHDFRMAERAAAARRQAAAAHGELERIRLAQQEAAAKRAHTLYLIGLLAGFVLSVGMLTGAVVVGSQGHAWLASALSGPSVLALASLFVLRRTDDAQTRAVAEAYRMLSPAAVEPAEDTAPS